MLDLLKIYLNISGVGQDTQLNLILTDCIAEFEEITGTPFKQNSEMEKVIIQMAIIKYNRLGYEGLSSQSYSGASEHYTEGYPKELNRRIMKYKKLRTA